ncbi:MAG: RIO1 family regulatory kinase/ATPase [archaeon]
MKTTNQKLIAQGAEAKIFLVTTSPQAEQSKEKEVEQFAKGKVEDFSENTWASGTPEILGFTERWKHAKIQSDREEGFFFSQTKFISKQRPPKKYRHEKLDNQIRTRRTKSETKLLTKAKEAKASVPKVLETNKFEIKIEFIEGEKLSETLNNYPEKKQFQILQQLGHQTAILHQNNIIHGDLTTSNVILKTNNQSNLTTPNRGDTKNDKVARETPVDEQSSTNSPLVQNLFIIDFGLGFFSPKIEDKAVDLHLIKQALEAKHYQNHDELFKNFLKGYNFPEAEKIIEKLKVVEKRGRYKH